MPEAGAGPADARASRPWSRRERRRAARHDGGQGCPAPCPTDLGNAPDRLRSSLPDRGFIDDSGPWLDATESWATATRTALRMVEAARAGKGAQAWELRQQLPALVAERSPSPTRDLTAARCGRLGGP
ncbi:hypothetical protein ACWD4L_07370 [Streptomyces sp. NPDC002596]